MDSKRLIEDYLPIEAISAAASSEPRTKGHISTMHIWRARRPLVACRAAVFGAIVPVDRLAPRNGTEQQRRNLGRANAAKFLKTLCQYPGAPSVIEDAQAYILAAHEARLESEPAHAVGEPNSPAGKPLRPKVLDMFAGGGAIPLEAARLGCESYAVELNPVAHIIELCTVTFPQQYGAELADDIERWGRKVLDATQKSVADVQSVVRRTQHRARTQGRLLATGREDGGETLSVVAHYWTRTVPCPNRQCASTVPLYRQTWLRQKESGYVALKPEPDRATKQVRYRVVEADTPEALGFDPEIGSDNSSTTCPFCRAAVTGPYVREYGNTAGFGQQLMCVITLNPDGPGKLYIADQTLASGETELQARAEQRAAEIESELGNSSLDEEIPPTGNAGLATGNSYLYGIRTFRQAFTPRQRLVLLTMAREIRRAYEAMLTHEVDQERAKAITTYLGVWLSRLTDRFNTLARWHNTGEKIEGLSSMKRLAMMWDYPELNLFGGGSGDAWSNLQFITAAVRQEGQFRNPTSCVRGSATELTFDNEMFDAVVTDPPYYDNESYSELSDVCYVWLRPTIGFLYPEHFASALTPKRKECVAAAYRQGGKEAARRFYEDTLFKSLQQAHRVTKPGGVLVLVYAHKTTLGWSTLVDAIRRAGYEVREAWPLDTETKARVAHRGDAALASSIFLVARKRGVSHTGNYEADVRPTLDEIVRERVETLWEMGISGADLVIASVGAGLRAFTRFEKVEYANGEAVPAERFLTEVEGVVLDTILARLSRELGKPEGQSSLVGLDPATRFYVLWRYTYGAVELDAGEAIIFANGTHVELDGPSGLSNGANAVLEKKKSKYRLRDYSERGGNEDLGLPNNNGASASAIDGLQRLLWLQKRRPPLIPEFLAGAGLNLEQLRLVAQSLAGPALKGGELKDSSPTDEQSELGRLLANWHIVIEGKEAVELRQAGQQRLL